MISPSIIDRVYGPPLERGEPAYSFTTDTITILAVDPVLILGPRAFPMPMDYNNVSSREK